MTEPLDLDDAETVARLRAAGQQEAEIAAERSKVAYRDAEIVHLRGIVGDCNRENLLRAMELDEARAEIARLRAPPGADVGSRVLADFAQPGPLWINRSEMRAPPGADVMERASLTGRQTMDRITVIIDSKDLADVLRKHFASAFPWTEFISCDDSGSEILVHLKPKDETPSGPGSVTL